MTSSAISSEMFKFAVFIGALAFVRWNLYESYRVDAFRQRMFDLRAELFDYAAEGGIGFDAAAYTLLRNRINRLIRFAHTYSMIHLLLALAFEKATAPMPTSETEEAIQALRDSDVRQTFEWINYRVTLYFAWHLVCSSWIALSIGLGGLAVSKIGERAKAMAEAFIVRLPGLELLERHIYAN